MKVSLSNGDISKTAADTVVVPVDGSTPEHFGETAARILKEAEEEAPVGFGNGRALFRPSRGGPWRWLAFAGTITDQGPASYAEAAFDEVLAQLRPRHGRQIAATLLTGGWRVSPTDAVYMMLRVLDKYIDKDVEFIFVENDPERHRLIAEILQHQGWT